MNTKNKLRGFHRKYWWLRNLFWRDLFIFINKHFYSQMNFFINNLAKLWQLKWHLSMWWYSFIRMLYILWRFVVSLLADYKIESCVQPASKLMDFQLIFNFSCYFFGVTVWLHKNMQIYISKWDLNHNLTFSATAVTALL